MILDKITPVTPLATSMNKESGAGILLALTTVHVHPQGPKWINTSSQFFN